MPHYFPLQFALPIIHSFITFLLIFGHFPNLHRSFTSPVSIHFITTLKLPLQIIIPIGIILPTFMLIYFTIPPLLPPFFAVVIV